MFFFFFSSCNHKNLLTTLPIMQLINWQVCRHHSGCSPEQFGNKAAILVRPVLYVHRVYLCLQLNSVILYYLNMSGHLCKMALRLTSQNVTSAEYIYVELPASSRDERGRLHWCGKLAAFWHHALRFSSFSNSQSSNNTDSVKKLGHSFLDFTELPHKPRKTFQYSCHTFDFQSQLAFGDK